MPDQKDPKPVKPPATGGAAPPATGGVKPPATGGGKPPPALTLPVESKYEWLAGLREITTTLIAGAIVSVTLVMLWCTFSATGTDPEKMKDVLLYALPLLGTVMGYYFGRVPAERRAEASEQKAGEANAAAQAAATQTIRTQNETDQKLQKVKIAVERSKAKLEGTNAAAGGGGVLAPGAPASPGVGSALDELKGLDDLL